MEARKTEIAMGDIERVGEVGLVFSHSFYVPVNANPIASSVCVCVYIYIYIYIYIYVYIYVCIYIMHIIKLCIL